MKTYAAIFIILIFSNCQNAGTKKKDQASAGSRPEFYAKIQQHFNLIDSFQKTDIDQLSAENQKLRETIEQFKYVIADLRDSSDPRSLYIVSSGDKKLHLISWNTRMGGTMIDFTTMAVYQTQCGYTVTRTLSDSSENPPVDPIMHYQGISTISTPDGPVYIAHGFGQGSTILPWEEVRAIRIDVDRLIFPRIFPDAKSNLFVEFDRTNLRSGEIPVIQISENGKIISTPVPDDHEGFTGKYQTYVFKDSVYQVTRGL